MMRFTLPLLLMVGAAVSLPAVTAAHEVPARVHVTGMIRPEDGRLRVLLRVPLNAMRDMEFPLSGRGFLDIANAGPVLHDAALLWLAGSMRVYENGQPLAGVRVASARVSLPSNLSFTSWADAIAHTTSAADARVQLPWEQAMLDVLLEYPIASADSRFAVNPLFAHLGMRTTTELRFLPHSGTERSYTFAGNPGLLRLNPAWQQVAFRFARRGAAAVGGSLPLIVMIVCTIIGFRRIDEIRALYAPFAVGAFLPIPIGAMGLMPDMLWVVPAVGLLVAVVIVYLSLETIVGTSVRRRARGAFVAGAIAGISLWYTLEGSLQFAAGQDTVAVLLYTAGAEVAVFTIVAIAAVLSIRILPRTSARIAAAAHAGAGERAGTIVLCAILAHAAWHWALEQGAVLRQYQISLQLSSYGWLQIMRAAMLVVLFAMVAGIAYIASRRIVPAPARAGASEGAGD